MPIKIPADLPANSILSDENIFCITEKRALTQDIRPLKIALLNIMPTKIVTETQLIRLLGNTPLQIEMDFIYTSTYTSKNTSQEHISTFYKSFDGQFGTLNCKITGFLFNFFVRHNQSPLSIRGSV